MKINNLLSAVLFLFIFGSCITQLGTIVPEKEDQEKETKSLDTTEKDRGPEDIKFDCGFEKVTVDYPDGTKHYFLVPRECIDQLVDNVCDPSIEDNIIDNKCNEKQQFNLR